MSEPVFVVFHDDIEDSKYVRGVFATAREAEAHTVATEPCHSHRPDEERDYPHLAQDRETVTDAEGCYSAVRHVYPHLTESSCCVVQEWEVGGPLLADTMYNASEYRKRRKAEA